MFLCVLKDPQFSTLAFVKSKIECRKNSLNTFETGFFTEDNNFIKKLLTFIRKGSDLN